MIEIVLGGIKLIILRESPSFGNPSSPLERGRRELFEEEAGGCSFFRRLRYTHGTHQPKVGSQEVSRKSGIHRSAVIGQQSTVKIH
jgi:hypothetical protein